MSYQEAKRAIRDAWIVGVLSIVVTTMLTMIYASGAGLAHVAPLNWLDLAIMSLLTFGIYKRNRLAIFIMPVYYLGVKALFWFDERAFIGLPIALIVAYFFWRAVRGIQVLHQTAVSDSQPVVVK